MSIGCKSIILYKTRGPLATLLTSATFPSKQKVWTKLWIYTEAGLKLLPSPFEKERGPLFEQIWISFTKGCFVPSLVEVLGKKTFISLWKRAWPFIWTKDALCQVCLKVNQWFWRRRFFKSQQCIFSIISPCKGMWPSFEQTWIPFTQGCFVPSFVEICSVVLEKKIF